MKFSEERIAAHMQPINGSAIREIFKLLGKPGMISFAGGNPSNAALEPEVIADIARDVLLSDRGRSILQYGATEGYGPFVESACDFLRTCGITATTAQVLPTTGSTQGMDLLLKALINPGDVVLVENPTFMGALQAIHTYNAKIVPVDSDADGICTDALEAAIQAHHPKLIYIIPTFQNPTGVTLPLERRKRIAELANQYGVIVAEDDPYRDLRYEGEPLPTIKSFDTDGFVVYLSSFSKLISPGMRVGTLTCTIPALMRKLVIGKQSSDLHTATLTQAIIDQYLRRGELAPHVARISESYRAQMQAMLAAFDTFPEGTTHTTPQGGLFLWGALPEGMDALALLSQAVEANVAFVPGTHFYAEGGHKNTFRLNFSNTPLELIPEGMRRLAHVIQNAVK